MIVTKNDMLKYKSLPVSEVILDDKTGQKTYVRVLSEDEYSRYDSERYIMKNDKVELNLKNINAKLVLLSQCDESGVRIWNDKDLTEVCQLDSRILRKIADAADDLNGITKEKIKEKEKNSDSVQPNVS